MYSSTVRHLIQTLAIFCLAVCSMALVTRSLFIDHTIEVHRDYVALIVQALQTQTSPLHANSGLRRIRGTWHSQFKSETEVALETTERALIEQGQPVERIDTGLVSAHLQTLVHFPEQGEFLIVTLQPRSPGELAAPALIHLILLVAVLIISFFTARPVMNLLDHLIYSAESMSKGDFEVRAPEEGPHSLVRLAVSINRLAQGMDRMVQEQKVITHALNHEIRTPLARLRLAMDMLYGCTEPDSSKKLLAKMDRDIEEMESLAKEMLQWARLSHHHKSITFQMIPLSRMLQDLCSDLWELKPNLNSSLNMGKEVSCMGNLRLLRQAVENTIRNAQRYADSTIAVTLEHKGSHLSLFVDDDGPGIPSEDRERVFIPFECLEESRSRQTVGFGLGMAIVHQIMLAHGGRAEALDSPLGGARIHLTWASEPILATLSDDQDTSSY